MARAGYSKQEQVFSEHKKTVNKGNFMQQRPLLLYQHCCREIGDIAVATYFHCSLLYPSVHLQRFPLSVMDQPTWEELEEVGWEKKIHAVTKRPSWQEGQLHDTGRKEEDSPEGPGGGG